MNIVQEPIVSNLHNSDISHSNRTKNSDLGFDKKGSDQNNSLPKVLLNDSTISKLQQRRNEKKMKRM